MGMAAGKIDEDEQDRLRRRAADQLLPGEHQRVRAGRAVRQSRRSRRASSSPGRSSIPPRRRPRRTRCSSRASTCWASSWTRRSPSCRRRRSAGRTPWASTTSARRSSRRRAGSPASPSPGATSTRASRARSWTAPSRARTSSGTLNDDFLTLAPFGPAVPADAVSLVEAKRRDLIERHAASVPGAAQGQPRRRARQGGRGVPAHRPPEDGLAGRGRGGPGSIDMPLQHL